MERAIITPCLLYFSRGTIVLDTNYVREHPIAVHVVKIFVFTHGEQNRTHHFVMQVSQHLVPFVPAELHSRLRQAVVAIRIIGSFQFRNNEGNECTYRILKTNNVIVLSGTPFCNGTRCFQHDFHDFSPHYGEDFFRFLVRVKKLLDWYLVKYIPPAKTYIGQCNPSSMSRAPA